MELLWCMQSAYHRPKIGMRQHSFIITKGLEHTYSSSRTFVREIDSDGRNSLISIKSDSEAINSDKF